MSSEDIFLEKMMVRYKSWLNDDEFTVETAAFEYMKRNPYFIEVVHFFNTQIEELRDDPSRLSDLQFVLDRMKITLERLFLYTGSDVLSSHIIGTGGFTFMHNRIESMIYDLKNSGFPHDDYHYSYSHIYDLDTSKQQVDSAEDYKKQHTLDMDMLLEDRSNERWLKHLRPSLYLKFNPYHSQERLIKDILDVLRNIEQKIPEYATPEILINEYAQLENSFITPNDFRIKPSAVALIIYDLVNILKFDSVSDVEELLKDMFGHRYKKYKFSQYFTQKRINNDDDYEVIYASRTIKEKMTEVLNRINGGYLKHVYSKSAQKAHFNLLFREFMKRYEISGPNEAISVLKDRKDIKDKLEYLLLHVKSFTDEECKKWADVLYDSSEIPKNDIYKIILM